MSMRRNKPLVHICSLRCKLLCFAGHHHRQGPESKCRCCHTFDNNTAHELSRSQRSEVLAGDWWGEERPVLSQLEKRLYNRVADLLKAIGQTGRGGAHQEDDITPTGS